MHSLQLPFLFQVLQGAGEEVMEHVEGEVVVPLSRGMIGTDFCKKQSHTENKCWKKNGKPDWAIKKDPVLNVVASTNALPTDRPTPSAYTSVTLSHKDFQHLLKMAHGETNSPSASVAQSGISNVSFPSISPWFLDSGATDHMISSNHSFSTYVHFKSPLLITLADVSKVPAVGRGNVPVNPNLLLHDVLLMPSFPMSLLLCNTGLYQIIFTSTCVFQDARTRRDIGHG